MTWLAEEFGECAGVLEMVSCDVSDALQRIEVTTKCVACGQVFSGSANFLKSNAIKVPANWKPLPSTESG